MSAIIKLNNIVHELLHNVIFSESHDLRNCQQFSMSKLMWNKFSPSVTKCSKGEDNIDFAGSIVSNHIVHDAKDLSLPVNKLYFRVMLFYVNW